MSAHANMPRYSIRADVHFDAARGLLIALIELPGVRKTDVRISLAQCPHSRMKVLAVAGVGPTKLERYGAAVLEIVGRHAASSTA